MALLDVCDAVRAVVLDVTDTTGMEVDDTCAEPLTLHERTVYVFDVDQRLRTIETGGQTQEEAFAILAVYVHRVTDEEPLQERQRDVSQALSDMRDAWITALLAAESHPAWGTLTDVRGEYDYIRTLQVRGIAVRVQGTRVIG